MKRIVQIWFDSNWLYGKDEEGTQYRQSVLWYRRLMDASPAQRADYTLSEDGMHWRSINEDIGFESFIERNNIEPNPMQTFFLTHREINLSSFAKKIGINANLVRDYINGWKTPSSQRKAEILSGVHTYAQDLQQISF